jgi:hypothetical protein
VARVSDSSPAIVLRVKFRQTKVTKRLCIFIIRQLQTLLLVENPLLRNPIDVIPLMNGDGKINLFKSDFLIFVV